MAERKQGKFGSIAPYYGLFFDFQIKYYYKILDRVAADFDVTRYKTVLDIGCGTGALCQVLYSKGLQVTGIDAEENMIRVARRKLEDKNITLLTADINQGLTFADKSFDLVISSYVAHGLKLGEREKLYTEMKRLACHYAILHDYNQNRALLTDLIEKIEGGDYPNFIREVEKELRESFSEVHIIEVDKRAAWYICTAKE